ncbi:hypothetical protein SCLCIDRAFT_134269 [Scleroderma citrinum Foug A]|uniref:Uncharacterized protein n=1 Tax=Scleroderma citrinum Foug A TaxID=1036808 RepID=A0A0C3D4G7_9AGAM|nr:hypothetical protein SCLCIDRAFT_134269 [Scleroderma citrinum Foug A]
MDYFEELQTKMVKGKSLLNCLMQHPPDDELGIETDENSHEDANGLLFDLEGIHDYHQAFIKQEFTSHLLFSSPHLCFSGSQKKAMLTWSKTLGTANIPLLYALDKVHEQIMKMLGNPTEKFTVPSGNTFYLNSIGKAIAMEFSNPLTRFTMQDYPEDGQGHMSQVHHGQKMLEEIPCKLAPPCVHVNHNIFFVDKLLQQESRQYFIPKKFFQAKLGPMSEAEVLTVGHKVGFAVDPEQVIMPVSTFVHTFEDIHHHPTEFAVEFTHRLPYLL